MSISRSRDRRTPATAWTASCRSENLTGSGGSDILSGNDNDNVIDGVAGGDDVLAGRGGDDILRVAFGTATADGGSGNDIISFEDIDPVTYSAGPVLIDLSLTTAQHYLYDHVIGPTVTLTAIEGVMGSGFDDTLLGSSGDNLLDGGAGSDTLTGRGGHDVFRFDSALDAKTNVDTITDFAVKDDSISLGSAVFDGLKPGELADQAFYIGSKAHDADDRIIYNADTGALLFDADGSGKDAAVAVRHLTAGLHLTAENIVVI